MSYLTLVTFKFLLSSSGLGEVTRWGTFKISSQNLETRIFFLVLFQHMLSLVHLNEKPNKQ